MGLYENIKAIAEKKGISVNKLEKELGLPRSSIMKYNASVPSVEKVRQIANYLEVTIDEIINTDAHADGHRGWYTNPETAEIAQRVFDDPDLRILFDAAHDCKPEDIRMAAEMLRKFKGTNNE